MSIGAAEPAEAIAGLLRGLAAEYRPTPLLDLPDLARRLGLAQVLVKDEGRRFLGSFKSLGGTYAGLLALARAAGLNLPDLLANRPPSLPALICASDGNHGLAVAAAARMAGGASRVFLHAGVPRARARRIEAENAEVVWIAGTYDDAVEAAAEAADGGAGILVADTSTDADDPIVRDVMAGYGVIAHEIRAELARNDDARPTHLFVQAGVGGLAAAMTEALQDWMAAPALVAVVEPERVACVAAALAARRPTRLPGTLDTAAEMLSCGEASASALAILQRRDVRSVQVSEDELAKAPARLRQAGGPATTPSGAAGLAGLAVARASDRYLLDGTSRVLVLVTEAEVPDE